MNLYQQLKHGEVKTKTRRAAGRGRQIKGGGKKERKKRREESSESKSHPVFSEKQIDGGVSYDVHAEFKGLDLPGFSWLGNLGHFHGLVISGEEELPQTVPKKVICSGKCKTSRFAKTKSEMFTF